MKRRLLSLVLAFVMVIGLLPVTALAASTVRIYLTGGDIGYNDTVTVTVDGASVTARAEYSYYVRSYYVEVEIDDPDGKTVTVTSDGYSGTGQIDWSGGRYSANVELSADDTGDSGDSGTTTDGADVYLYTMVPGVDLSSTGNADDIWNGMGVGTITGFGQPSDYVSGTVVSADPESILSNVTFKEDFPAITVDGTTYQYVANPTNTSLTAYYTIQWTQLVVAPGANAGANNKNPVVPSGNTFHLDGQVTLKEVQYVTVSFSLKDVGSTHFVPQSGYSVRVPSNTLESALTVPSFPAIKTVNGIEYVFDGWYLDDTCSTSALFNGTVTSNTTYYARYVEQNYTVSYDANGGSGAPASQPKTAGVDLILSTTEPTRDAYTFIGWNDRANGAGTAYQPGGVYSANADVTLYAQWQPHPGTLVIQKTFAGVDVNSIPSAFRVVVSGTDYSNTLSLSAATASADGMTYTWTLNDVAPGQYMVTESGTEITGYNFVSDYSTVYSVATVSSNQISTVALSNVYEIQKFTVTWKNEDTTLETDNEVSYGTMPEYNGETPIKAGGEGTSYIFAGWSPTIVPVTQDVTYTATFSTAYTVTYTDGVDGVEVFPDQQYTVGKDAATPAFQGTPSRTGYEFSAWTPAVAETVTASAIYTATWNPIEYTISYTGLDGATISENPDKYTIETATFTLNNPTKAGYTFAGWTGTGLSGATQTVTVAQGSTGNRAYTATWTANTNTPYKVEHYQENIQDNGFTLFETENLSGTTGARVSATEKNYDGLTYDSTVNGTVTSGIVAADGGLVLKLYYVRNTYTVTWMNSDRAGTLLETDTKVKYGAMPSYDSTKPSKLPDSHYTYSFTGWTDGTNTYAKDTELPAVTGDITYTAVYEAIQVRHTGTVKVVLNGTYNSTTHVMENGALVDITTVLGDGVSLHLKSGETYYDLTRTDTGVYSHDTLPDGDYYIYTKKGDTYTLASNQLLTIANADRTRYLYFYSVTYDLNGGSNGPDPLVEYHYDSTRVTVSKTVPTKDGYVFAGWKDQDNNVYAASTDIASVVLVDGIGKAYTLTAQWNEAAKVNVKVVVNHKNRTGTIPEDLYIQLTTKNTVTGNYNVVTNTEKKISGWVTSENTVTSGSGENETRVTTYATEGPLYTNLDPSGDYGAYASIKGYNYDTTQSEFVVITEAPANTFNVTIYLVYDPDGFELEFNVEIDPSTPERLIPEAVDVKVTVWDATEGTWEVLREHTSQSVEVVIDQTKIVDNKTVHYGTGKVHVWGFNGNNPYLYRLNVVRIDLGDYQLTVGGDGDNVNYTSKVGTGSSAVFPAGAYTAQITVGETCSSGLSKTGGLYGSHAYINNENDGKLEQHDPITATVTVHPYTLLMDPNGGQWSDGTGTADKSIVERFTIPNLTSYVPTQSGHTFDGWYTKNGNDGDWGEQASLGKYIKDLDGVTATAGSAVKLYAKWKSDITVEGTIAVAGTYVLQNGDTTTTHTIYSHDRLSSVKVALQKINASGNAITVAETTADINYGAGAIVGTGPYEFKNVPDDGEYRIYVLVNNYAEVYQNEPNSLTNADAYDSYKNDSTSKTYMALKGNDTVATVNAYLEFVPKNFNLRYDVDATEIDSNFRPSKVEVLVLCDDGSTNDGKYWEWAVISQMVGDDGTKNGQELTLGTDGKYDLNGADPFYPVWQFNPNGYAYDYAIRLQNYTVGGVETAFGDTAPFTVQYVNFATYVEGKGQDLIPVAKLIPKTYPITYVLDGGSLENEFELHTWSKDTEIPKPTKAGYMFMGWTADDAASYEQNTTGNIAGVIPAAVAKPITLTAHWELDQNGDEVPDKYQRKVTFQVVNGYWNGDTNDAVDKVHVVTLTADGTVNGDWSESGTATVAVPAVGSKPAYGYSGGVWNPSLGNTSLEITRSFAAETTYVYTYTAIGDQPVHYNAPGAGGPDHVLKASTQNVAYGAFIQVNPNGGNWSHSETTYTSAVDLRIEAETTLVDPTRAGCLFMGWEKTAGGTPVSGSAANEIAYTFTAQWEKDEDNNKVPDKYQKKIIFKVVNGSWEVSGGNADYADRVYYVTLVKDGKWFVDGTADISGIIPDTTNAVPAVGYLAAPAAWDPVLPTDRTVSGTDDATYSYCFTGIDYKNVTYADFYVDEDADDEPDDVTVKVQAGKFIRVDPNDGLWKGSGAVQDVLILTDYTLVNPTRDDHVFLGWKRTDGTDNVTYVFTAQWVHVEDLLYTATVETYLDGSLKRASDIHGWSMDLYLKEKNGTDYIPMTTDTTGVYTADVNIGTYYVYHTESDGSTKHQVGTYQLNVSVAGENKLPIYHYSVTYDLDGGVFDGSADPSDNYFRGTTIYATEKVPVKAGYEFKGWSNNGQIYSSGAKVADAISSAIALKAEWSQLVHVKVNVTILHNGDNSTGNDAVTLNLVKVENGVNIPTGQSIALTKDSCDGFTYAFDSSADKTTYLDGEPAFANLSNGEYRVTADKAGYSVSANRSVEGVTQIIDITLTHAPDSFELYFDVAMKEGTPKQLFPKNVNVKILAWGYDDNHVLDWQVITQQANRPPISVAIDPDTGTGIGSYTVWKNWPEGSAYEYRIMITGFDYGNGKVVAANESTADVVYTDGNYTGTITIENGGRVPSYPSESNTTLPGAYFDGTAQKGRPTATIEVETYKVVFDAVGGLFNDGEHTKTVEDQYMIPDFAGFPPERDSYKFNGWYYKNQSGEYTTAAAAGTLLSSDVTLYAKWEPIQKIAGTIEVAGTYTHNGQTAVIHEVDRPMYVTVILQEKADGTVYDLQTKANVPVTWVVGTGTAEYSFENLTYGPNYQITVRATNYSASYRNEGTIGADYVDADNNAEFIADPTSTFVNAKLNFAPNSYNQELQVDASAIGTGFRPDSVHVEILGTELKRRSTYDVISQHKVHPYGITITLNNGVGSAAESIWKYTWDNNLYQYQMRITQVSGSAFDAGNPYYKVTYGDTAHWDTLRNQPNRALTATLIPYKYDITYDMNIAGVADEVETDAHTWSFETTVDKAPTRTGYVFMGWYDNEACEGARVTSIAAAVHTDTKLYAKWEADIIQEIPDPTKIGDGIPDIYQCVVEFRVVNGTWTVSKNNIPIQKVYTLAEYKQDTKSWVSKTVKLGTLPTTTPDASHSNSVSGWHPAATSDTLVTGNAVYTYTYHNANEYAITVIVENGTATVGGMAYTNTTTEIDVTHDSGTTTIGFAPNTGYMFESVTVYKEGTLIANAALTEGKYTFNHDSDYTIKVVYTEDKVGASGVPDKYEKKITFKVVNGTWADGTIESVRYVTLRENGVWSANGSAVVGELPVATANAGYKGGSWDAANLSADTIVVGTDPVVYTYTCKVTQFTDYVYTINHYRQQPNGTYALADTGTGSIRIELNEAGDGFESGKVPTVHLTETQFMTYGAHYDLYNQHADWKVTGTPVYGQALVFSVYYRLDEHTLSYDLNGAPGQTGYDSIEQLCGNSVTVKAAPSWEGYVFEGWKVKDSTTVYQPGDSFGLMENLTLEAQWRAQTGLSYTVMHWEKDTNNLLSSETKDGQTFGTIITSADQKTAINGYVYDSASPQTLTIGTDSPLNIINLYYTKRNDLGYKVNYLDEETGNAIKEAKVVNGQTFNAVIASSSEVINIDKYVFIHPDKENLTIDVSGNVINLYYAKDEWNDADDKLVGGDNTPDYRQIVINYAPDNEERGSVSRTLEVATLDSKGPQDITVGGASATAKDGYIFDGWSFEQRSAVEYDPSKPTIAPTIKGATGYGIYNFTANFIAENAVIDVEKVATQTSVAVGETIVWTITVKNEGNVKLTGITLSDTMSGVIGTASVYENPSDTVALDLSTYTFALEAGTSKTFTAKYVVKSEDAGKSINNTVVAKVDETIKDEDTPVKPVVVKNPGLNVTKTVNDNKTIANVGETITWTVKVENTGNTTLTGISLADTLYAGDKVLANLELKDAAGNIVTTIAELKPETSVELTASYKVTSADAGKTLKNVAVAVPNDGPSDQGESATTKIPDPYIPPVVVPEKPEPPKLNKEDHFAYIIGKDDGMVHPLDHITRAETATIFFRMLLEESRQYYWTQENNFVDVKITDWFNNAASTLSNAGIMTGRPGGQFAPYTNITRGEFATMAVRFFLDEDVEIAENNLTDVKGHWAEANINLAYALGLITGYPDNTFKPNQEITRAEAMVIVNRVLERHPHKDHLLSNMITWPDNMDPNVWYYADVQEATNSHLYTMMTDGNGQKYEIWQQLLPVRDWAALEKAWSDSNSSHNPGEVVDVNKGK